MPSEATANGRLKFLTNLAATLSWSLAPCSQLPFRRRGFFDRRPMLVVHQQDGEAIDDVEFVRAQAGVLESAPQVGVAVLVELHLPVVQPGIDLDVRFRQRLTVVE